MDGVLPPRTRPTETCRVRGAACLVVPKAKAPGVKVRVRVGLGLGRVSSGWSTCCAPVDSASALLTALLNQADVHTRHTRWVGGTQAHLAEASGTKVAAAEVQADIPAQPSVCGDHHDHALTVQRARQLVAARRLADMT